MEAKTKKNLIIWGVILLVVLNVSSLATIWLHRYQYSNNKMNNRYTNKSMGQHQRMNMHGSRNNTFFTKGLNLSNKQQTEFDSVWNQYSNARNEIELKLDENRQQMSELMNQLEVDTTRIYKLSADQGMLMQELDLSMIKMNLALRTVLDKNQMQLFLKKIETLSKRRSMSRKPGERMRNK